MWLEKQKNADCDIIKTHNQKRGVKTMIYGYARVSSKTQIKGYSLEEQTEVLQRNGCDDVVSEQYTGKTTHRPEFEKLKARMREGDTLMVCKIDRFARNLQEGIETVRELTDKGIKVHILNMGLVDHSVTGKLIFNILMAIAEWEREMILERTAAGKAVARTKPGFREGRPRIPKAKVDLAMELLKTTSYKKVEEMTGISVASLVRYRRAKLLN